MFPNPTYPPPPTVPTQHPHACHCRTAPTRGIAPVVGVAAAGVAVTAVVGLVLTALLVAMAVTAVTFAVAALVLRTLFAPPRQR